MNKMNKTTITEKMEFIVDWMSTNRPKVLETFNPPAEEKDFVFLENLIDHQLSEDFKAFYLFMNGQDCATVYSSAIIEPESEGAYSISQIESTYKTLNDSMLHLQSLYQLEVKRKNVQTGIKALYWNTKWIPIIAVGNGDYYLMDLDPDIAGVAGQIIHYDHEGPIIKIVANSFNEWIGDFIKYCLD